MNSVYKKLVSIFMVIGLCVTGCKNDDEAELPLDNTGEASSEMVEETTEYVIPERNIDWQLVWSDEFDGDSLDLTKWSFQTGNSYNGWGNYEAQYYTEDNVSVRDGMLIITAKKATASMCLRTAISPSFMCMQWSGIQTR